MSETRSLCSNTVSRARVQVVVEGRRKTEKGNPLFGHWIFPIKISNSLMKLKMATSEIKLCFQCDVNPRMNGDFLCKSCKLDHKMCYECGEKERNHPFKLCTDCYKAQRNERDGVVRPTTDTVDLTTGTCKYRYVMMYRIHFYCE